MVLLALKALVFKGQEDFFVKNILATKSIRNKGKIYFLHSLRDFFCHRLHQLHRFFKCRFLYSSVANCGQHKLLSFYFFNALDKSAHPHLFCTTGPFILYNVGIVLAAVFIAVPSQLKMGTFTGSRPTLNN
jgi:hypothetical protein